MEGKLPENVMASAKNLMEYLIEHGVSAEAAGILRDEEITGTTLSDINESDLKEMKVKIGQRKRILQIIRGIKEEPVISQQHVPMDVMEIVSQLDIPQLLQQNLPKIGQQNLPFNIFEIVSQKKVPEFQDVQPSAPEATQQTVPLEVVEIVSQPTLTRDFRQIETPDVPLPEISMALLDQNTCDVCIRSWLQEHPQGKDLIRRLETKGVNHVDRKLMVRIVCDSFVRHCKTAYPSSQLKEKVARSIVKEFPALCSRFSQGHESFYNEATGQGFIEYRLKTLRTTLKMKQMLPERRPKRKKPPIKTNRGNETTVLTEEVKEKISWMKMISLTEHNKPEIISALIETRPTRQEQLQESGLSVAKILCMYPRIMDFEGEMIEREFLALHPDSLNFLEKFRSYYVPRILKYAECYKIELLGTVSTYVAEVRALFILPELLPVVNYGKGKRTKRMGKEARPIPYKSLIHFVKVAGDIIGVIQHQITSTQPLLVVSVTEQETKTYIKVDSRLIPVPNNILIAFDLLVKFHFVFNIQYAHELTNFYDFISSCIYGLSNPRPCSDSLDTALRSVAVDL